jgi:eukaryotic-like serine/threonine-protein kinase
VLHGAGFRIVGSGIYCDTKGTTMTDETLFAEALAIAAGPERVNYLEKHATDQQQKLRVEELLNAAEGSNFLDNPVHGFEATQSVVQDTEPLATTGEHIGPYKLVERIGEGGMGEVWVALQNEPVKRRVAVKLIKAGLDSKAVLARFEAERQALALMDHPNIAKVLDAGSTKSGRPYFVMELVKGVPITQYCDDKHLTLRQRLELFVPICHAIQHAHQKGIIHRDIKPTNVLVALYDDQPVPKVIDFGVAKAAGQTLTDVTLLTGFGAVVGTPEYMSPEQASLNNLDIDTRSDVYSLGVLLYELLTGSTPVDRKTLGKAALLEILRVVREVEAPRPSSKLSTVATLPSIAANRGTEPKKLSALMKGELDWVLMKALEKDRTRRYDTANGLARDIQRYLADELVEARPPSASYRMNKFVRRHKGQVAAASLVLIVFLAGIAGTTYGLFEAQQQARQAELERTDAIEAREEAEEQKRMAQQSQQLAEREARSAQAVRDFLSNDLLLQSSTSHQAAARLIGGGEFKVKTNPTVEELLDRAAQKLTPENLEIKFPGMPLVQAEVLATIGISYFDIGFAKADFRESQEFLERAIELFREHNGLSTLPAINARERLARIKSFGNELDQGISLLEEVIEDMNRVIGPFDRNTITSRIYLAYLYAAANHPNSQKGYHLDIIKDAQKEFGPHDSTTILARLVSAYLLLMRGERSKAVQEMESLYKLSKTVELPLDNPDFMLGLVLLATAYRDENRTQESIEVEEYVLDHWERNGMATDPLTRQTRHLLGWNYMRTGNAEKALETFRKNVPASKPPYDVMASEAIYNALMQLERYEEALTQIRKTAELPLRQLGKDKRNYDWGRIQARIGYALVKLKRHEEATAHLLDGYHQMIKSKEQQAPYDSAQIPNARMAIYQVYQALNRNDDANRWAEEQIIPALRQESSARSFLTGQDTPESLKAAVTLAAFYKSTDRIADTLNVIEALHERGKTKGWPLNTQTLFSMLDKTNGWPLAARILSDLEKLEQISHDSGRTDLAVMIATDARAQMSKIPKAPKDLLARCEYSLGRNLSLYQKPEAAVQHLREALKLQMENDPDVAEVATTRLQLAVVLLELRKYSEAEPLLVEYCQELARRQAVAEDDRALASSALDRLIETYAAMDKPDEAERFRLLKANLPSELAALPREEP